MLTAALEGGAIAIPIAQRRNRGPEGLTSAPWSLSWGEAGRVWTQAAWLRNETSHVSCGPSDSVKPRLLP